MNRILRASLWVVGFAFVVVLIAALVVLFLSQHRAVADSPPPVAGQSNGQHWVYLPIVRAVYLPPDPSTVAPPVDRSVPADIYTATLFLYTGRNPIQTGVAPGTIDPLRVAVVRGRVLSRNGAALAGVRVGVLNHTEYGQTLSRADGAFDLVVNGGAPLVVDYQSSGVLPLQREQAIPVRDYTRVPDVVMQPVDTLVTLVASSAAGMQIIRSTAVVDDDGARSAALLVPPDTRATLIFTGGITQTLAAFHARITEYTVGERGPNAMPAGLPPQSGYTYAVEYSVDEAEAAGAINVGFSQPLIHYSHNFLDFPPGMAVPTGYYDRLQGRWVASANGRVVKIIAIAGGLADLDTDGDGIADNGAVVTPSLALTITAAERQSVAQLFQPGQSLWRVPVSHFSPWDCNWPYGPPPNARQPRQKPKRDGGEDDNCDKPGSIVVCQSQVLGEDVDLAGTPFQLHYQSDRAPGRRAAYTIDIPLTDAQPPEGAIRVDLIVDVAGRTFETSYAPAPNLRPHFTWDGRDGYGRETQGAQPATVRIGYVYTATYQQPAEFDQSFAAFSGVPLTSNRTRQQITLWQVWHTSLGAWDGRGSSLGGWSLSVQHIYDVNSRQLLLGDGGRRSVGSAASSIISTRAGVTFPPDLGDGGPAPLASTDDASGVLVAADGTLYIADTDHGRVRRVAPDGAISTVAGGGSPEDGVGDGLPATQAALNSPRSLALGADGSLYISEFGRDRVRRVLPSGIITTFAGGGSPDDYLGDGLPATQAMLSGPSGLALAANGTLYIADRYHARVRQVGSTGIISTYAGDGGSCDLSATTCGEGGPAAQAQIDWPAGLALTTDGRLFVSDASTSRVLVVAANGILTRIAGTGEGAFGGDGGPALQASLYRPEGLAWTSDGSLYIADSVNGRVRRVMPSQVITTFAGSDSPCNDERCGEGGPAVQARLTTPLDVASAPDGRVYIADAPSNFGSGSVRVVLPGGIFLTAAGRPSDTCQAGDGLPATLAGVCRPSLVALMPDGSLIIGGDDSYRLRRIRPDGVIMPFAGTGRSCPYGDPVCGDGGPAAQAFLDLPTGLAAGPDGSVYLAEGWRGRVRRIGPDGIIRTVAGCGDIPTADCVDADGGPAGRTYLYPYGLAVGADGSLYIYERIHGDLAAARVRRLGADGRITTVAGGGHPADWVGDGLPAAQARLYYIAAKAALAFGPDGSLYVADLYRVRRIGPDGVISTVAGNGTYGFSGDGGWAVDANLAAVQGLVVDSDGSVYLSDAWFDGPRVRRVGSDGLIMTVAGGRAGGWGGDDGPAAAASLNNPQGLAIGPDGVLYIADTANDRLRRVSPVAPGYLMSDLLLPSDDGSEVYVLRSGRHLRTLNALTGAIRYQFAYDTAGRLISIVDGDGNLTRVERDAGGNPAAIVAPGGQRTSLAVDALGYLRAITSATGATTALQYTPGGLITRLVDARGGVHQFAYDAQGLLIRDDEPSGGSTTLARVDAEDVYTVTATDALNRATRYTVERIGGNERRARIDPSGARTEVVRAPDGSVEVAYPDGTRMSLGYTPDPRWGMQASLLASAMVTTPGGLVSTRAVSRTVVLSDTRNPLSLAAFTDTLVLNGRVYTTTYDGRTRTLATMTPEGAGSITTLDAQGRVVQSVEAPGMQPSAIVYDAAGRLSQVRQGDVGWTYGYDAANGRIARSDSAGNATRFARDAAGRVVSTTLPGAGARTYLSIYDAAGNRTQLRMPGGAAHQLSYAPDDQWASYTAPGNPPYSAVYNLAGQRVSTTLPGGRTVSQSYDAGGRLAGVTYPEAAYTFGYADAADRPTLLQRAPAGGAPAQSIALAYDGDLVVDLAFSGPAAGRYAYGYDADHALISMTLQGAAPITFTYDQAGRLAGAGPYALARGGPGGRVSRILGIALDDRLGYDADGRPISRTVSAGGPAVYAARIGYDNLGRIAAQTETVAGATRVYSYVYDANSQLTQTWRDGALAESAAYDPNGNRISRQQAGAPAEPAVYDAQDRLTQRGGTAYTFDADGYLAGRGSDTFVYTARGELIRAVVSGQAVTYGYDAWGRRVSRADGAGTRQYLYGRPDDLLRLTASRDPGGTLTQYLYDDSGRLFALQRGGAWYAVATDAIGTPRAVIDAAGAVVKTLEYGPFGDLAADSNPAFDLVIGFAGGLADPATGLVRFGWRDYDPAAGRWAARDPLLFDGESANLYLYVGNNPLNLTDPTGLLSIELSGGEGIGGGVKGSITREGTSFCVEVGFVVGGGLEVDPAGDLDPPTVYAKAELAGKLGPISGQIGAKADECMNDEVKAKFCSGPLCAEADFLTGKMGSTMSPPEKGWTKMRGAKLEGKAVVGKCWRFKW